MSIIVRGDLPRSIRSLKLGILKYQNVTRTQADCHFIIPILLKPAERVMTACADSTLHSKMTSDVALLCLGTQHATPLAPASYLTGFLLVKHAFRPSRVTLSRPRAAMQTLTSRVPPVVAESWRVPATRRRTVSPRRGVPAKAGDNAEIKTAEPVQARESRKEGRPVHSPDSYQDICYHVYQSVADGIADGLDLMEVEFPAVPGEDASYKAASDVYIDLNIQYALTVFSKLHKETGKTCELLVPDGPEYRRAKKVFANSLELSEGCTDQHP